MDGHHPAELATVRYTEHDYWNVLSGGTRLAADAATRIRAGVTPFGVPNERVLAIDDGARVVPVFFTDTVLDQLGLPCGGRFGRSLQLVAERVCRDSATTGG